MPKTHQEAPETTETTNTPTEPLKGPQGAARAPEKPFSQEEVDRIRAVGGGGPRKFGLSRLPDGSFRLDVTIPVELSACLESQADGAQEPLETYIQRMVVEGLESILGSNA